MFAVLAFFHAVLWGLIVPLWQVNDESAHFEYVHLLTRLRRLPTLADADPYVQAQILRSMWENRYWEYMGFARPEHPPQRFVPGGWMSGGEIPPTRVVGDAYIGSFSQLSRSTPLYYLLLTPLQALTLARPIDEQLHTLRWGSRVLFALGVLFIVLASGELFAWRTWPVLISSAFVSLHPMFAFIGSGLNNDNGAMLFASATVWQVAQGWRHGYSLRRLVLIGTLLLATLLTKRTAGFLVVWIPLVLGVWWLQRQHSLHLHFLRLAIGAASLLLFSLALYLIPGPSPAGWHIATPLGSAWQATDTPFGSHAFRLQNQFGGVPWAYTRFRRPIGMGEGYPVIITAYARGGSGTITLSDDVNNSLSMPVPSSPDWQQIRFTTTFDSRATLFSLRVEAHSAEPLLVDNLQVTLLTDPPQSISIPNPSAEIVMPLLSEIILAVARPLGVYTQAFRFLHNYRENLNTANEWLPIAILFAQQSFWGWIGEIGSGGNPTLHPGWLSALAFAVGLAFASSASAIVLRRPDGDTARLLTLWLIGFALLLTQTFAPMLSFGADRNWLPQGRYLFTGMALIAPLLSASTHPRIARIHLVLEVLILLALTTDLYVRATQFFSR